MFPFLKFFNINLPTFILHCSDIVPTLCGHISPGIYVRTISFFGLQLCFITVKNIDFPSCDSINLIAVKAVSCAGFWNPSG